MKNFDSDPSKHELGHSCRVFLVDDDAMMISLFTRLLKRAGYAVESTTDSTKALEILQENPHKFDVFVADYRMPFLNGNELLEEARKCGFIGKRVIISGHVPEDPQTWRELMNADAVVGKTGRDS